MTPPRREAPDGAQRTGTTVVRRILPGSPTAIALGVALLAGFVLFATPALAHVPGFAADNDDPGNATYVSDPAKSLSFYDRVAENESAYYRTYLESGDRLLVTTFTPRGGATAGAAADGEPARSFDPGFVIMSPALNGTAGVPPQVEVPEGYGARVVEPDGPARGEYEPFTPAALYRHAELDMTVETSGTYDVVASDREGDPGNVGVVVGHAESFTVLEYVTVPFDRPRIHQWEGQSAWVVYGPMLVGFVVPLRRYVRRTDPAEDSDNGPSERTSRGWLLAGAAGLYTATALAVAVQTGIAVSLVGVTASLLVTIAFVVIPLGLAWYLLDRATATGAPNRRTRGAVAAAALLGVATWAGFVVGPLLALAGAVLPE